MRIQVDQIPRDGFQLRASLTDRWARDAAALALDAEPQELSLSLLVERVGPALRVSGEAHAAISLPCDRCQRPVYVQIDGPVDLRYFPEGAEVDEDTRRSPDVEDEDAIELSPADLDMGWFDGKAIELDQVVSEQFALLAPPKVCCDTAGALRQPGPCTLPAEAIDARPFSPFAGIRLPK